MLISIIFVMSLGIVLPIIMGGDDMNKFVYLSSFLLVISEGMLLYLLKTMIPPDEMWHQTGEKGQLEEKMDKMFKLSIIMCIAFGALFGVLKYVIALPMFEMISFEFAIAIAVTPLMIPGVKALMEEGKIIRKERNFLGFLPALGSISSMRGGKINESVYYLSEKDYGVLTGHIKHLYRRLRTRINDDDAWEWFGVDTGSNYIQRSSEMFREATFAAANPRKAAKMISENIRKIRDLRVKKLTIVNTSIALFAGITFGIAFCLYISLIIGRHLNNIMLETGDPFSQTQGMEMGTLLHTVPPNVYNNNFIFIFIVLVIHCFMLALTLKMMRGSHKYVTYVYFVPFVWIVAVTSVVVQVSIGGMIGAG
jgi:archaellum biogenesis protein FlaJ (TadC family)